MRSVLAALIACLVAGVLCVPASAAVFSSTEEVSVPMGDGPASLYPWTINATGLAGVVTDAEVALNGVTHGEPDELDVMLEAPAGQRSMVMSDAAGSEPMSGLSLAFRDNALFAVPDDSGPITTTYRPTDFEVGDTFPDPAPAGPHPAGLAGFRGALAAGSWRLWITDDGGSGAGTFSGWSLRLLTSGLTQFRAPSYRAPEGGRIPVTLTRGNGEGPVTIQLTAVGGTAGADEIGGVPTTVTFGPGETQKTLAVRLLEDRRREPNETTTLALGSPDGFGALGPRNTVPLTIVDDDSPPAIGRTTIHPKRFKARLRGKSVVRRGGAVVRYRLSQAANIRVRVQRRTLFGYRRVRGSFEVGGTPGANRFRFSGRVRDQALLPGRYRLTMRARGANGKLSRFKRVTFAIKRPRRYLTMRKGTRAALPFVPPAVGVATRR